MKRRKKEGQNGWEGERGGRESRRKNGERKRRKKMNERKRTKERRNK